MASSIFPQIDRLKGKDNFSSWKFACKALLEDAGLWELIDGTIKAKDAVEDRKACKDSSTIRPHHSGLTRKIGLLQKLITTRLDEGTSVDEYINNIISITQRLNELKFNVGDEW
ncbi:hypothetical protein J437_LFUL016759, partial [Ladona fulva]